MAYLPFPRMLQLETTPKCNATCVICPNDQIQGREEMPMDTIEKIIHDCEGRGLDELHPFFTNEPLMDTRLMQVFDLAQEYLPGTGIHLYSNMSLMTERHAYKMLEYSNFKFIAFSLDGATQDVFEKMRPGLAWDKVRKNCDRFLELRSELGRKDVHVKVVLTKTADNEVDVPAFQEMWADRVDEIMVMGCDGRNALGKYTPEEREGKAGWYSQDPRWPCRQHRCHQHSMYVLSNSNVVLCCKDILGHTIVGNLERESVEEIWKGETMYKLRKKLDHGIYDEEACKRCPMMGP